MRRSAVEVEVILLHILSMVAFTVGQTEESFLENRILAVPQCQRKTEVLFVIGDARQAVFAPTICARAGMIMGEKIPSVAPFAIVLAHRAPLTLTEIRSPFLPWDI